jgi:hypothetical protein
LTPAAADLLDQVSAQCRMVLVQGPQLAVDLSFLVTHADLEQPRDMAEQDQPLGSPGRHGHDPAVSHEGPQHGVFGSGQDPVLSAGQRSGGYDGLSRCGLGLVLR